MCTHIGVILGGQIIREGRVGDVLRGLSSGRTVRVTMLTPAAVARAVEVLAAQPGVEEARPDEASSIVEADISGDDAVLSAVLRALIDAGLAVVSFAPTTNNLEEIFMQLTDAQ